MRHAHLWWQTTEMERLGQKSSCPCLFCSKPWRILQLYCCALCFLMRWRQDGNPGLKGGEGKSCWGGRQAGFVCLTWHIPFRTQVPWISVTIIECFALLLKQASSFLLRNPENCIIIFFSPRKSSIGCLTGIIQKLCKEWRDSMQQSSSSNVLTRGIKCCFPALFSFSYGLPASINKKGGCWAISSSRKQPWLTTEQVLSVDCKKQWFQTWRLFF